MGDKVVDELLARIARLERAVRSRDSYIEGLIHRNRALRIDVYTRDAELIRLRGALRQAGVATAVTESTSRIAVASLAPDPDTDAPTTQREPGIRRATRTEK